MERNDEENNIMESNRKNGNRRKLSYRKENNVGGQERNNIAMKQK